MCMFQFSLVSIQENLKKLFLLWRPLKDWQSFYSTCSKISMWCVQLSVSVSSFLSKTGNRILTHVDVVQRFLWTLPQESSCVHSLSEANTEMVTHPGTYIPSCCLTSSSAISILPLSYWDKKNNIIVKLHSFKLHTKNATQFTNQNYLS